MNNPVGASRNDQKTGPQSKPPWTAIIAGGCALFVFLLPSALLGAAHLYINSFGLILPGIRVADTHVGWMSTERATSEIDQIWNDELQITISDGTRVWSARPVDLGLEINAVETVKQAYEIGRGQNRVSELLQLIVNGPISISPSAVFHEDIGRAQLTSAAQFIEIPVQQTAIRYENSTWLANPGKSGLVLDIDTTVSYISENTSIIIASGYLPISMLSVPPKIENPDIAVSQLNNKLKPPLRFEAYDPIKDENVSWDVSPEIFGTWISIDSTVPEAALSIDKTRLTNYLLDWEQELDPDRKLKDNPELGELLTTWQNNQPFRMIIWHNPTNYVVRAGENLTMIGKKVGIPYWKILEANPQISFDKLPAGVDLLIPSKNEMLPMPVISNKRIEINIGSQRLYTYENGVLRDTYITSTGIDSSPTHPGVFQVQTHELEAYASVWDLYMPHFLGIYEGWPGFMNGIHGLPTLSSGKTLWADVLGRPASYGCIILNLQDAEDLYNWADNGVVVEITY
jgi:lipoprotein-anchoring transpeptidase ErfK/SrfK